MWRPSRCSGRTCAGLRPKAVCSVLVATNLMEVLVLVSGSFLGGRRSRR